MDLIRELLTGDLGTPAGRLRLWRRLARIIGGLPSFRAGIWKKLADFPEDGASAILGEAIPLVDEGPVRRAGGRRSGRGNRAPGDRPRVDRQTRPEEDIKMRAGPRSWSPKRCASGPALRASALAGPESYTGSTGYTRPAWLVSCLRRAPAALGSQEHG